MNNFNEQSTENVKKMPAGGISDKGISNFIDEMRKDGEERDMSESLEMRNAKNECMDGGGCMDTYSLVRDVPENICGEMGIPEEKCAYPLSFLEKVVRMHRDMFLEFYESTDFNREFFWIIECYLFTSDVGSKKDFMDSRLFKDSVVPFYSWISGIKMAALTTEDAIFETQVQENGPLSPEMEKEEAAELDKNIILWMADVYVLLSWAYEIPFQKLLNFMPKALYESYKSERFMDVTVCDAVKLIYNSYFKPREENISRKNDICLNHQKTMEEISCEELEEHLEDDMVEDLEDDMEEEI